MASIPQFKKNKTKQKRNHKLMDWTRKQDPSLCCIPERHHLRVKGWKKMFQANGPMKQAGGHSNVIKPK